MTRPQGTRWHAAAQWADLAGTDENGYALPRTVPGLDYDQVAEGAWDCPAMPVLAEVLLERTATPADLVLGLWDGYGPLQGGGMRYTLISKRSSSGRTWTSPHPRTPSTDRIRPASRLPRLGG